MWAVGRRALGLGNLDLVNLLGKRVHGTMLRGMLFT